MTNPLADGGPDVSGLCKGLVAERIDATTV